MRQIVLDTETTGLDHRLGDRVIEIAGVELVNRQLTGVRQHFYLNPDRDIAPGAQAIHGLSREFLSDKPRFANVVRELQDFLRDADLIIHNAPFDVGFLNAELRLLNMEPLDSFCGEVIDTLRMAREIRPGKKNNLDALCREYGVDNSGRQLHGALLDAELLAEVYLALTRGQESLAMSLEEPMAQEHSASSPKVERKALKVLRANDDELAEHEAMLTALTKESKGNCIWAKE